MFYSPFAVDRELHRQAALEEYRRQLYEEELQRRAYAEAIYRQRAYEEAARREAYRQRRYEELIRERAYREASHHAHMRAAPSVVTPRPRTAARPPLALQQRAAIIIQQHYRAHLSARRSANKHLEELAAVRRELNEAQSTFLQPERLDFDVNGKLAYSSTNATVHAFEDRLTRLLTKLDSVDSEGMELVRAGRKAIVRDIEATLDALDRLKIETWQSQQQRTTTLAIASADEDQSPAPTIGAPLADAGTSATDQQADGPVVQPVTERTNADDVKGAPSTGTAQGTKDVNDASSSANGHEAPSAKPIETTEDDGLVPLPAHSDEEEEDGYVVLDS